MRLFLVLFLLGTSLAADHYDDDEIIDNSNVRYPSDAFYYRHITSQGRLVIGQQLYPAMTRRFFFIHHWQRILANGERICSLLHATYVHIGNIHGNIYLICP